jgi:hypothetical protein
MGDNNQDNNKKTSWVQRGTRKGVFIEGDLWRSEAFDSLTRNEFRAFKLIYSKQLIMKTYVNGQGYQSGKKVVKWNRHKGDITVSLIEAEAKGITKAGFIRATNGLVRKGIIDITSLPKGGGRKKRKKKEYEYMDSSFSGAMTKYKISDRWKNYGTPEFEKPITVRKPDTRKGRGFAVVWDDDEKEAALLKKFDDRKKARKAAKKKK